MFGISFPELLLIALLILVFVGPDRLPEMAKWAGKGFRELRKVSNTLRDALLLDELDELRRPLAPSRRDREPRERHDAAKLTAPPSPTPPNEPGPREFPTAGPPSGLDQLDDTHFERLLLQEYHLHHNQLSKISLRTQAVSQELVAVPLPPAADSAELVATTLPPSLQPELTT